MPYLRRGYRKGASKYRKRSYRRFSKKKFYKKGKKFTNQIAPFKRVSLTYGDVWELDAAAGTYKDNDFIINSLYDPDLTGAGGQPSGFDAYATMYARYRVVSAKVTVTFINTSTQVIMAGMSFGDDDYHFPTSGTTCQQEFLEGNRSSWCTLSPKDTSDFHKTVSRYVSFKKYFGRTVMTEDDFTAGTGASPERKMYGQLSICNVNGTTVGCTCTAIVRVKFYTYFYQPHYVIED